MKNLPRIVNGTVKCQKRIAIGRVTGVFFIIFFTAFTFGFDLDLVVLDLIVVIE